MLGNLFGHAYKASQIASTVEPDIMRRMTELERLSYKNGFSWGTTCGNHIFDTAARRARNARLNEADQFILPILYMLEQAVADGNPGMVRCFDRILSEVQKHLVTQMSVAVLSESIAKQEQVHLQLTTPQFNAPFEGVVEKAIAEVTAEQVSKTRKEAADALNRRRAQQLDKEEQERREKKRQEREQQERERLEREQQERERLERQRQERERLEREQQERERLEREQQEREQQERERLERQRQEREQQERERLERQRQEREQQEREQQERDLVERQTQEKARIWAHRRDAFIHNIPAALLLMGAFAFFIWLSSFIK